MPARKSGPRPWTADEIATVEYMREKLHTVKEISDVLERPQSSVSNLLGRPGRMEAAKTRAEAPRANGISVGIAKRLDIPAPEEHATRKSGARETSPSGASGTLEPVVVVSDAHIPFESKVWRNLLLQVARYLFDSVPKATPKHLAIIGDFVDFYGVSDHDKAPERANRMDEELDAADKALDELDALGADDKLYIGGNHEDRLKRYLMKNPALARVVSVEKLLRLKERGWQYVPYKHHAERGAVHFTHDVGAAGRNAVFRALDVYGHSVVSGHTHRLAYIVEGTATGECKLSATFGWGGDVEQVDYMNLAKARKDWALGFGIGYLDPVSGFCYLVPIPVVHGTCMVNGRLFRAA